MADFAALNFDLSGNDGVAAASSSQAGSSSATTRLAVSDTGGARWTSAGSVAGHVWDVAALNRNSAFVATDQGLYATIDAGTHWSQVDAFGDLCQITFWTSSNGLATPNDRLATTSDGGRTLSPTSLTAEIDTVRVDGPGRAIAAGPTGIYVTDNSGAIWTLTQRFAAASLSGDQPAIATGAGAEAAVVYNEGTLSGNEVGGLFLTVNGRTWSFAADDSFAPLPVGSALTHWLPSMLTTTVASLASNQVVLVVQTSSSTGLVAKTCEGPLASKPWTCHLLPTVFFGLTSAAIAHPGGNVLVAASAPAS